MLKDTMLDIIIEIKEAVENNAITEANIKRLQSVYSQVSKDIDLLEKMSLEQPTMRRKTLVASYASKCIAVYGRLESALNELTEDSKTEHITHIIISLNDAYKMIKERI